MHRHHNPIGHALRYACYYTVARALERGVHGALKAAIHPDAPRYRALDGEVLFAIKNMPRAGLLDLFGWPLAAEKDYLLRLAAIQCYKRGAPGFDKQRILATWKEF